MSVVAVAAVGTLAVGAYSAYNANKNKPDVPDQGQLQQDTQYNTVNPAGSSTFTTDPNTGERTNTTTYSPTNQTLYEGVQGAHGTNADLANALAGSQGGNIGAGIKPISTNYTPINVSYTPMEQSYRPMDASYTPMEQSYRPIDTKAPTPTPGQTVLQTNPNAAFTSFQNTGVLPPGYAVNANGQLVSTGANTGTAAQPTSNTASVGTDAPGDTGGGSGMPSPTATGQTVVDAQGNPVYGTSYGNGNNAAYMAAMGVKPKVAAQDFFAWQQAHPNGEPMPAGWTLEGSMGGGQGGTTGGMPQYKSGTLGKTVGEAPTLGTVGAAEQMARMTGDIPQGQTVSQAEALARLQSPDKISAYTGNTPVGAYQGGGDIAAYNGAAPRMGTTATPGAQKQFAGEAPTPEMIKNGGSVAGAGEGIMRNLDLSNLGNMPTASEATLKQVQDALYARQTGYLDPQMQAQQAQLNARLANQGIGVGARANTLSQAAEASAREKAYAGARNDAILMGGAEQQRLFNMQMAARQQGYTEDLGVGAFQNAAQGQGYAQQLANQQNVIQGTTANNAAQNAQLAAQMAIMNQNNQASQTDFQNQFNITGQNNAAQQALGQYSLGAGQLNANIGNMNAQNQLGAGQLNAQIGIANNAANLGAGQLNANIAQNNFANNLATAGFNNTAIQGDITNQLATTGFNNQVGQQGFANQLAQNTFNNTAAQQNYQNQLAQAGFNNTAANQGFQNTLAGTGFNNQVQQQDVANQFSQQGLNINAAQAAAQMAQAKASAASAAGSAAAANAARMQQGQQWQQQFNANQNQQQFNNYMGVQGFNNGVTNTGNTNNLNAFNAGINANNSNISGLNANTGINNSNISGLNALTGVNNSNISGLNANTNINNSNIAGTNTLIAGNNSNISGMNAVTGANNSNISGYNSNLAALQGLQNNSGPVGNLPGVGGGTSNATQTGYVDAYGNWQGTNQNNNMILNSAGQLVPLAVNAYQRYNVPGVDYGNYGTGPGSPQYGGPGGG